MRKIILPFLLLISIQNGLTQTVAEISDALDLVKQNKTELDLTDIEISNSRISSTYYNSFAGTRMVYLQQTHLSMDVYNQMQVIAFKNNRVVSNTGGFIKNIENRTNATTGIPVFSAVDAVKKSLEDRNLATSQTINPVLTTNNNKHAEFSDLGVASENITADLIWVPKDGIGAQLCWQVQLVPKNSSDFWYLRIDAITNTITDKNNQTVSCNWKASENKSVCYEQQEIHAALGKTENVHSGKIVNGASYTVVPYPAESPQHAGGTPAVRTNPWLLSPAGSNATSLKWNSNGTTDYSITRGNNVYAYEDRNADNIAGIAGNSTTSPDPLTFGNIYNFTLEPIDPANQQAAITNLFYWNNIIHDLSYLYGFDEVSGNFQVNNLGRGGLGTDAVNAEAQDGSGSDNANFNTQADGIAPRMQMYLWPTPTPDRDGDMDNGIITHEYGHGISNRFTGGPATASCLNNAEQMGEGWSDYLGLMYTTNWATAVMTDSIVARGIGTYALNQPTTGVGIRQYPYTHNMAVNPFTYANITTVAIPHGIGSVWCTMLWDLTWDLIGTDGINSNLFNASGAGGNSVALKLVMEGMRLQPCSPGFVDGRNAILKADTLLFGGVHSCTIWKAFARRGVGINASQGLSTSRSDQTVDFTTKDYEFGFTQNVTEQSEGRDIVYTVTTKSICSSITNFKVVDTLPSNVTYISGGTYNAGDRTVTFSGINLTPGNTQVNSFTVRVNAGAYFPPFDHFNEPVAGATIPVSWLPTSTTADEWRVSNAQSVSAPNSFYTRDTTIVSDQILTNTGSYTINGTTLLSFQHLHNAESTWDGGVVEISTNNGTTWSDLGNYFTSNGYTTLLNTTGGNPLAGRLAFSGNSTTFKSSVINLTSFVGNTIKLRFRFGSDNSTGTTTGWFIDNIVLNSEAAVFNTAKLFDAGNVTKFANTLSAKIILSALPVQWISFNAAMENQHARLQWITENEQQIKKYEVERSENGTQFIKIGEILPVYLQRSTYPFTDLNSLMSAKILYYRIKILEKNGSYSYSRIVKLSTVKSTEFSLTPNPAKDYLYINGIPVMAMLDATITDISGRKLNSTKISFSKNQINIAGLEKGIYLLQLRDKDHYEVYRFVKD
jgi:hypothetical protein